MAKSFLEMTDEERANLPPMEYPDQQNGDPPFTSYYDYGLAKPVTQFADGSRYVIEMKPDGTVGPGQELSPAKGSIAESKLRVLDSVEL